MKKFFIVLISIIMICLTCLGVIGYFVEKDEANNTNQTTTDQGEEITQWKVLDTDTLDINNIEGYTPGGTVVEKTIEENNNSNNNSTNSNSNNNSNSSTNNTNNSTSGSVSGSGSTESDTNSGDNSSDNNTSNEGTNDDNSNDNQTPPTTETPSGGESSDGASNASYMVSDNTSLDSTTIATVASIQTATDSIVASKATDEETVTVTEVGGLELPFTPPYKDMEIISIGGYTGSFVEDGSDDKKQNVLAMVIKNTSDKVIDYGEIIIKIQGQNIGLSFKVSDLKPGSAALVLESSGEATFSEDDKYTYLDSKNEFVDEMDMMAEQIKITTEDNKITVENISEENLNTVYVYYKTVSPGGCYLGGLTYRAKFVKLTSGKIESVQTHHFDKETSEIIKIESVSE